MTALTVSGDLVHYEVLGRGRPVILLHGMLGSWRYWIPTIQFLQQNFRLYALDLYGFGDSAKKQSKYSLEHQIALVEDFMSQLGVEKCALIGHDIGAIVAAEFARRYPNRVPRLMVVSGPLFDPGDLDRRVPVSRLLLDTRPALPKPEELDFNAPTVMSASAAMRAALREAAASRRPGQSPPAPTPDTTMLRKPSADLPVYNPFPELLAGGAEPLLLRSFKRGEPNYEKLSIEVARSDPQAAAILTSTFDAGSLLDTFRLLPMPTVIIHGADDAVTPVPNEAVLNYLTVDKEHALVPFLMPDVRHFPMLEDAARFNTLVKECLDASDIAKIELRGRWTRRAR